MKILITGSNGLLGQKLVYKLKHKNDIELIASSKGENRIFDKSNYKYISLDVTNETQVSKIVQEINPDVVINTAAMTNVDDCEDKKTDCIDLNVNAVLFLANACFKTETHLVHISSDFIFDGKSGPYKETDSPNPLSFYGKSKLDSENILNKHKVDSTILRTIVVFGVGENLRKNNFVLWAISSFKNNSKLNVIDDQFRAPTLAEDLADACISAAKKRMLGTFHVSGKDIMSIYEMVVKIAKYFNYSCDNLHKINTSTLSQKAKRPPKTGFILDKAKKYLNYKPHSFEECLSIIDKQLNKTI